MAEREIYFKADLTANRGAGDVSAAEDCERDSHAIVELVLTTCEALDLVFAEALVISHGAVGLNAEGDTRIEVVQQGDTAGVDVTTGSLNTNDSGAGVPGKKEAEVGVEPGFLRKGFLCD